MKTQLFKLSLSLFVIYSLTACNDEKPVEDNKANVEETKEKDRVIAIEKLEKIFQNVSYVYVSASKSYFHDAPDFSTKRKAYLVKYDEASLLRTRNGFGYVEYYNYDTDKTTSGWMSLTDLEGTERGD